MENRKVFVEENSNGNIVLVDTLKDLGKDASKRLETGVWNMFLGDKNVDRRKYRGAKAIGVWTTERYPVCSDCSPLSTFHALVMRQLACKVKADPGIWECVPIDFVTVLKGHVEIMDWATHISCYSGQSLKKVLKGYFELQQRHGAVTSQELLEWDSFTKFEHLSKSGKPRLICMQAPWLNALISRYVQSIYKAMCAVYHPVVVAHRLGLNFPPQHYESWDPKRSVLDVVFPATKLLCKHELLVYLSNISPYAYVIGSGLNREGMRALFCLVRTYMLHIGGFLYENDFSRYDSSQGVQAFAWFRSAVLGAKGDSMFKRVHKAHEHKRIKCPDGTVVDGYGTLTSGAQYTTLQNTLLNLGGSRHVFDQATTWLVDAPNSSPRVLICAAGDDSLYVTPARLSEVGFGTNFSKLGFETKLKQVSLIDATFLASQWWPGDEVAPELARWAFKFGWALTHQPDDEQWYREVCSGAAIALQAVPYFGKALYDLGGRVDYDISGWCNEQWTGVHTLQGHERERIHLLLLRYPSLTSRKLSVDIIRGVLGGGFDRSGLLAGLLRDGGYGHDADL